MADVIQVTIEGSASSLVAAANQATSALGQVEQAGAKMTGAVSSALSSIGQGVGIAAGIAGFNGLAGAMGAVGNAAIGLNSRLEQAKIGFTSMLGSVQSADAMLRDLQQFAAKTPFQFPELVTASQRMLAFGFSARDVIPLLTSVGSAAAAMGTGASGVDRITNALGQMKAATVVQLGELNQLTEAGVPAFEILAQAMGKSTGEVKKLVSQGKIASDVFINAFQEWAKANFGDMMEKQSKTFSGAMSTIQDTVSMTLANAFQPLFQAISAGAVTISEFVSGDNFQTWAVALQVGMAGAISSVGSFLSVLAPIGDAISVAFGQFTSGEFAAGFSTISTAIQTALGNGLAAVQAFATEMFGAGVSLVAELASGIIDAGSSLLTSAVNSVAEIIAGFLIGNSPPAMGPLAAIREGGANTITAWGEGAMGAVDSAVTPVVQAVSGNLDQLKDAGRGADQSIRDIGRSIQELESQSRDLKNASEDVKRVYDDQIKALDDQIRAIEKAANGTREREKLEMSLEEHMLRQAEVQAMGDPILRAQLRTRLESLKSQQTERKNTEAMQDAERLISGSRKDQLKDQQDALAISRQEADLRARLKDAKTPEEKSRIQAQLKELELRKQINAEDAKDRQQAAERRLADAKAKQEELTIEQQLDGMTDKEALARIKSEQETLRTRKEELTLAEQRAKIEAALATGPLKEERERLVAERDAALAPLKEQLELISRQKEALTEQRQAQQAIKQEIVATMQALKEQAKAQAEAATNAVAPGGDKRAYEPDKIAEAAVARAKEAGAKLASSIGEGFSAWIKENFVSVAVGALGAVVGGGLGATLGAAIGGPIGGVIGWAVGAAIGGIEAPKLAAQLQSKIEEITGKPLYDSIVEKVAQIPVAFEALKGRVAPILDAALRGDVKEALSLLGTAFSDLGTMVWGWVKTQIDKVPWDTVWTGVKLTAGMIADAVIKAAVGLDAALTKWLNTQITNIKWAEVGATFGRALVGSVQQGSDQAGADVARLDTAGLQAGLAAFLSAAMTGAWEQSLENWRAQKPGESYGAVFVEGLDKGGIVPALANTFVRADETMFAWAVRWHTAWQAWATQNGEDFAVWDAAQTAGWVKWATDTWTIIDDWGTRTAARITAWQAESDTGFTTWIAGIGTILSDGWNAIWKRVGEAWDAIGALISQKGADINGEFTNMVPEWVTAGTDMAMGLVTAVKDGLASLAETVLGPIRSAIAAAKGLLNFGGGGKTGPTSTTASTHAAPYMDIINRVAAEQGEDPALIAALIDTEQSGAGSRNAQSGASGLMQVVPGQGFNLPGENAFDPETSIRQGIRTIKAKRQALGPGATDEQVAGAYFGYGTDSTGMTTGGYQERFRNARAKYTAPAGASIPGGGAVAQVNQFTMGLDPGTAQAACGPAALAWFMNQTGRTPTAAEAVKLAQSAGWDATHGMYGPGAFGQALTNAGISNVVDTSPTAGEVGTAAASGSPFAISTGGFTDEFGRNRPGHYYQVQGGTTDALNVGGSGEALIGGKSVMSLAEIQNLSGPMNGIITLAGQMGGALTTAGEQGGVAFQTLGEQAAGTVPEIGTVPPAVEAVGSSFLGLPGIIQPAVDEASAGVLTAFDMMGQGALTSVTSLGDGVLTTTQTMAGGTIATVTDMAGQVTNQSATLANGVSLNMSDMGIQTTTSVNEMAGTVTTLVTDLAGNAISTTTNMQGQVVSQFTTMSTTGSAAVTTLGTTSTTQFGVVATAATKPVQPINALQATMDSMEPPEVGDIVSAFDEVAQAAQDAQQAAEDAADAIAKVGSGKSKKKSSGDKSGGNKNTSGNRDDYFNEGPQENALGGPVKGGVPVIVGDGGRPELFVPGSDGYIFPSVPRAAFASGGGYGSGSIDYDQLAAALARQPIVVEMNGQIVAEIVRGELIATARLNGGSAVLFE